MLYRKDDDMVTCDKCGVTVHEGRDTTIIFDKIISGCGIVAWEMAVHVMMHCTVDFRKVATKFANAMSSRD